MVLCRIDVTICTSEYETHIHSYTGLENQYHDDIMTIAEPRWWRYVLLEDVDGVGFVRGFVEGTPQDIIDKYKGYCKMMERRRKDKDPIRY